MPRSEEYVSRDFSNVEPILVTPSGGTDPQAAVAWEELAEARASLSEAIATKVGAADIEAAVAALFYDVPLTGGITENRPGVDNRPYFFTRFEINLVNLSGNPLWATRRFNDDALLDANGNQIDFSYSFRITGEGTFTIEFQSASRNPVIADGEFTLVVQRRPSLIPAPADIPAWIAPDVARIGEPLFRQIFTGMGVNDEGIPSARFANGNTFTEEFWGTLAIDNRDYMTGVTRNAAGQYVLAV